MSTVDRHTREDLLTAAAAGGFKASGRLITDWVGVGLLDRPTKRGLGRGRGTVATWPENQLQLFLLLLGKRQAGARRVATLSNIPVALWVYYGDAFVPTRQVRRALTTWATTGTRGSFASERAARQSAFDLIEWLAPGTADPSTRDRLADVLGPITFKIATGRPFDPATLVKTLAEIITPPDKEPDTGPTSLAVMYAETLRARVSAIARLGTVSDELFAFARGQMLLTDQQYAELQPELAARPRVGHVYTDRGWEERVSNACSDVFTLLGFVLLAGDKLEAGPPNDPQSAPATARTARGHGTGTSEVPDASSP